MRLIAGVFHIIYIFLIMACMYTVHGHGLLMSSFMVCFTYSDYMQVHCIMRHGSLISSFLICMLHVLRWQRKCCILYLVMSSWCITFFACGFQGTWLHPIALVSMNLLFQPELCSCMYIKTLNFKVHPPPSNVHWGYDFIILLCQ